MTAATSVWACPAAVEVLDADAPRDTWLAERQKGLGGSDTSAVFGINRYTSPIAVWLDKTGRADPIPDNGPMEWGRRLEPVVADWFAETQGIAVRRAGLLRSAAHPLLQCTPDRLTADGGGLEVKTLSAYGEHEWDDGQIPDHAELQAQKCLLVTGRSHWWVAGLADGRRPHLRRVERDEAMIAEIAHYETWWWNAYVATDEMPPLDDTAATNDAIRALFARATDGKALEATPELLALLAELRDAKQAVALAEAALTGVDSRVRLALGDADVLVADLDAPRDGSPAGKANVLLTAANNGAFSEKAFTAAHPGLAAICRATVDVLDRRRLQDEHPDVYRAHRARVIRPRKALDDLLAAAPAASADTPQEK